MESESLQQGIKRKRYEPPKEDLGVKIGGKLHHDLKEIRKAAKKAKTFETQKIVKKLKGLRRTDGDSDEISELEAQLETLKDIAHDVVANTAFKTKLNKDKLLSENEHIQAAILKEASNGFLPANPTGQSAKLHSRLLSSKFLAVEVAAAIEDLKNTLQPKLDTVEAQKEDTFRDLGERPKKLKKIAEAPAGKSENHLSLKDTITTDIDDLSVKEYLDDAGWESGTVDDEESEASDADSGDEKSQDGTGDAEFLSNGADENDTGLQIKASIKKPSKPSIQKSSAKASAIESTFLPSLAVGFVRGGSQDSAWSDSEAKIADIDIKKNRRGQRARRAIWEKKYGRNANHKKVETTEKEVSVRKKADISALSNHTQHRAMYNKDTSGSGRGYRDKSTNQQHHQPIDAGWGQRHAEAPTERIPPKVHAPQQGRRDERPLHPSWEAKKKLKEKQSAGIVPSLGTKIKF